MTNETETPRRSAVVTGSNRGIGRAVAEELARAGFDVCVNCSSERGLDEARAFAAALEADCGVRAIAVAANVADAAEAAALVDAAQEAFGRVDVLVNNAGITRDGLLARMKDEDFDAVIDVNLKGTFNCCKAAAQRMMKQRYGRIVNMSSVVGVARAMRQALEEGGFTPDDLGHLNAHGTGTPANDATESKALLALCGEEAGSRIPVTSVKGTTGHTLGAAGAIEAIVTALSVMNDCVPPTAGFAEADPECPVSVVIEAKTGYPQKVALSNSLGFGGHNASLAVSPYRA